jgi:hypothetical protein
VLLREVLAHPCPPPWSKCLACAICPLLDQTAPWTSNKEVEAPLVCSSLSLTCWRWRSRWGPWTGPRDGKGVETSSSLKSVAGWHSTHTHRMTSSLRRDSSVFDSAGEATSTTSRSWSALSSCPSPRSMHRCPIKVGIFYGFLYIVFYCQGETQARGFVAT